MWQEHALIRASLVVELLGNSERKLRFVCLFSDLLVCAKLKQALPTATGSTPSPPTGLANLRAGAESSDQFDVKWFIPIKEIVLYKAVDKESMYCCTVLNCTRTCFSVLFFQSTHLHYNERFLSFLCVHCLKPLEPLEFSLSSLLSRSHSLTHSLSQKHSFNAMSERR